MAENLNFGNENLFTYFQDDWVLTNASISDNILTIQPGGNAYVYLTNGINEEFMYFKLRVTYKCASITDSNNYQTSPTIYMKEAYKNNENVLYRGKTRAFCFNYITQLDPNIYQTDETIFQSLNRPLYSLFFKIDNTTESVLYLQFLELFKSIDISDSQVHKIVETLNSMGNAESIIVNHNDDADYTLNGLEFTLNSGYVWKVKPTFYNGQLIAINTNDGRSISVTHLIRDTDLGGNENENE